MSKSLKIRTTPDIEGKLKSWEINRSIRKKIESKMLDMSVVELYCLLEVIKEMFTTHEHNHDESD